MSLLDGRSVLNARLDERTADLTVEFEGGQQLHLLVDSSGHEPWNFRAPGVHVAGLGGGGVAEFPVSTDSLTDGPRRARD
jgi:hypothetical protein